MSQKICHEYNVPTLKHS